MRYTDVTLVNVEALKADLAKIARMGYAVDRGEWREGVGGLAAPAFNGFERPVAALGICGPLERLTPTRIKQLAPLLLDVAAKLSEALGYRRRDLRESA